MTGVKCHFGQRLTDLNKLGDRFIPLEPKKRHLRVQIFYIGLYRENMQNLLDLEPWYVFGM